jgi:hypothetical protein
MGARFVPAEDEIIRRLWERNTAADIGALIGRTAKQVNARTKHLGVRKRQQWNWTPEAEAQLRQLYPDLPTVEVARQLGCSESRVNNHAYRLGLKKSEARRAEQIEQQVARARTDPRVRANQFKPGQVSHNKGRRMPGYAAGRMAETQFKKGRPPSEARNYLPIGSERVDEKRRTVIRKVSDDQSLYPAARWRPVHVLVWEAEHGPVPAGHIVRFRDGMKTLDSARITVDRLELVTLAENMHRNSYHTRYPKELGLAIQARGALMRKINRLERESRHEEQD